MLKVMRNANIFAMVADLLGAAVLAVYGILIGPLGVLRGPLAFERTFWYVLVLLPQGLVARSIRAAIDWRMGSFDAAIAQLEGLVGSNEDYYKEKPSSRPRKRVLEDLYTVLARAYLHAGHIDDAMLVVIRAKKSLGVSRLSGLAELDAKTAHLVRAGLAAGRLLDGGGLATMFVKSHPKDKGTPANRRQGATKVPGATSPGSREDNTVNRGPRDKEEEQHLNVDDSEHGERNGQGAKVIRFPTGKDVTP